VERVGSGLANVNVLGLHRKALVELRAFCAVLKRSLDFLVLDEKHRRSGHSCLGGQGFDSVHDAVDVEGRFRSRTQSLLDIDDEQGVFHGLLPIVDLGQRHLASRDRLSNSLRLETYQSHRRLPGVRTGVWKAANLARPLRPVPVP
jgi:hypothetical protein